jgi:hypothetical protein
MYWGPGAPDDTCGLFFRRTDLHNYYILEIDQNQELFFSRLFDDTWQVLQQLTEAQIRTGSGTHNHLLLVAIDDEFYMFVNNQTSHIFTDSTFSSGQVGIEASTFQSSDESRCIFRDIWVWDLTQ